MVSESVLRALVLKSLERGCARSQARTNPPLRMTRLELREAFGAVADRRDAYVRTESGATRFVMLKDAAPPARVLRESLHIATPLRAIAIREATAGAAPQATVVIIRAGLGNPTDRHFYSESALKEAVEKGLFDGAQCFFDHPTTTEDVTIPERRVEMLAGYFQDARMATDGGRPAVVATFIPESGNGVVLDKLRTAVAFAKKYSEQSYVGWSINALGTGAPAEMNGKTVNRVDYLTKVVSVDLVTKAGAGGRLLTFRESYRLGAARGTLTLTPAQHAAIDELVAPLVRAAVKTAVRKAFR